MRSKSSNYRQKASVEICVETNQSGPDTEFKMAEP